MFHLTLSIGHLNLSRIDTHDLTPFIFITRVRALHEHFEVHVQINDRIVNLLD